ncbi:MAG TPA: MFS transporter [Candidatus Saccharimonadales bacterium]|nr:MFS transporter [Candidatus Saccharimonadales bacterium]
MEYLRLLRHGNFAKLWFAQILSQVGQNLLNFALIILVYDLAQHTRFANSSVALLVIAFGLPALLIAPMAGVLVDRWDRKTVLVVSNVLRAILVPLYLLAGHRLWLILLLSFIVSSILQFFVPAEAATIPNTVPKRMLLLANSLFIFSLYAAFIVGYSASGPAVQFLGSRGPYLIVTVMMALAAVLTSLLPPQPYTKPTVPLPRPHLINDLRESWKLINENAERFFAILQLTITQAVVSILITLAPALSLALLHIPLQDASHVLIIPVGVGMVLGVMLVSVVTKNRAKATVIQAGLIIASITLTLVGLSGELYRLYQGNTVIPVASISLIVGILMLVLGLINSMISAAAQTLLQESTTNANRGKVFASLNMMINLAATAPILITGFLADLLSVTRVITIIGAILTVYSLFMVRHYRVLRPRKQQA